MGNWEWGYPLCPQGRKEEGRSGLSLSGAGLGDCGF